MSGYALGLIETKGLVGAIEACDAAAKSAQVTIKSAEITDGGLVALKIEGDLAAVRAAVDSGARAAERIGELIAAHVIARPDEGLDMMRSPVSFMHKDGSDDSGPPLPPTDAPPPPPPRPASTGKAKTAPRPQAPKPKPAPAKPVAPPLPAPSAPPAPGPESTSLADLEKMSVVKLRQFARSLENLPIQGRQISMANKTQLIEALKSAMNLE